MLTFCGFDLELAVEAVLARDGCPALCRARDLRGGHWLILQVDDDPAHLAWLCAPLSERAIQAVACGEALATDAVRHSATGTVELVVVDHGRAVPDRCLLCADVGGQLLVNAAPQVGTRASLAANSALAPDIEAGSNRELVAS
jgi:hypothetical protein